MYHIYTTLPLITVLNNHPFEGDNWLTSLTLNTQSFMKVEDSIALSNRASVESLNGTVSSLQAFSAGP